MDFFLQFLFCIYTLFRWMKLFRMPSSCWSVSKFFSHAIHSHRFIYMCAVPVNVKCINDSNNNHRLRLCWVFSNYIHQHEIIMKHWKFSVPVYWIDANRYTNYRMVKSAEKVRWRKTHSVVSYRCLFSIILLEHIVHSTRTGLNFIHWNDH